MDDKRYVLNDGLRTLDRHNKLGSRCKQMWREIPTTLFVGVWKLKNSILWLSPMLHLNLYDNVFDNRLPAYLWLRMYIYVELVVHIVLYYKLFVL